MFHIAIGRKTSSGAYEFGPTREVGELEFRFEAFRSKAVRFHKPDGEDFSVIFPDGPGTFHMCVDRCCFDAIDIDDVVEILGLRAADPFFIRSLVRHQVKLDSPKSPREMIQ